MTLVEVLQREGVAIKGAPMAFAVCVLTFVFAGWGVIFFLMERDYRGVVEVKNATIENLRAVIANPGAELLKDIPTRDPKIRGKLWSNGGVVCVSEG